MSHSKHIHAIDLYVGEQLKKRREALGISQHKIGKLVGVSYQQIQKYEQGTNRISAGKLWIFAKHLNCNVDDFYNGYAKKKDKKPPIYTKQQIELMELIYNLPKTLQNNMIDLCRSIIQKKQPYQD